MTFSALRYISLDYLDKMSGGDQETQKLLLEMLINEIPQAIAEMKQLFVNRNWKALQNASHKMKSTLAFVGNAQMSKANKKILDTLTNTKNGSALQQEINSLAELGPKVLKELKKVYDRFE